LLENNPQIVKQLAAAGANKKQVEKPQDVSFENVEEAFGLRFGSVSVIIIELFERKRRREE
jgi:hypothetical protein